MVVALVEVELEAVKFWRVVEPVARCWLVVRKPKKEVLARRSVVLALFETWRLVEVASLERRVGMVEEAAVKVWSVVEPRAR